MDIFGIIFLDSCLNKLREEIRMKRRKGFLVFFIALVSAIVGGTLFFKKKLAKLKGIYNNVVLFNGKEIKYNEEVEVEIEDMAVLFGGVDIDLRNAKPTEKDLSMNIFLFCSGLRIRVPDEWEVIAEGTNKSSGIDIKTDEKDEDGDYITFRINYEARYSGMEIS